MSKITFEVLFSLTTVALYAIPEGDKARAGTRMLDLPRNEAKGESDPNVNILRAMADAGNARVKSNEEEAAAKAPPSPFTVTTDRAQATVFGSRGEAWSAGSQFTRSRTDEPSGAPEPVKDGFVVSVKFGSEPVNHWLIVR